MNAQSIFIAFVIGLIVGEVLGTIFSNYVISHLRKAEQASQELVRNAHNDLAQAVHLLREHLQRSAEKVEEIKDEAVTGVDTIVSTVKRDLNAVGRDFIGAGLRMKNDMEQKFQEVGKKL